MDVEKEIVAFGETTVWVECDVCGRAYGRAGLKTAIVATGQANVCVDCLDKGESSAEKKQVGNLC